MSKKTNKPVTLKDRSVLPAGQTVTEWKVNGNDNHCRLASGHVVRVTNAFKSPSMATLERYSHGLSKSVLGNTVEPDGHDSEGSPSWLLVMGMI
jgi:hypothetical protein